jgi:hypothetical protein
MMDPTLDELIRLATDGAAFLGLTAAAAGTVIAGIYSIGRVWRRHELVNHYKDPYCADRLKVKPNIFNIRKIVNPEHKDKYWVRRDEKHKF